jgi:hypothetical protein
MKHVLGIQPVRKTHIQQQTNRYQRKLTAARKARRKHTRDLHRRERRRK